MGVAYKVWGERAALKNTSPSLVQVQSFMDLDVKARLFGSILVVPQLVMCISVLVVPRDVYFTGYDMI